MSVIGKKVSEAELGAHQGDSVFDFLYHDSRRVGSFLSQFDVSGHLQQIKQTESVGQVSGNKATVSGAKGIPLVAQGTGAYDRSWGKDGREGSERTYDPLWANARTLLDFLDDRGMIIRDPRQARIGDFVLVSGALTIVDLPMLKGIWEIGYMKTILRGTLEANDALAVQTKTRNERRNTKKADGSPSKADEYVDGVLKLLSLMPHPVQAHLIEDSMAVMWSSLREDSLIVSSSDLFLKHGPMVAGKWSMLGILDALPTDSSNVDPCTQVQLAQMRELQGNSFAQVLFELAPAIREQVGRPTHAYGITPILLFREVSPIR